MGFACDRVKLLSSSSGTRGFTHVRLGVLRLIRVGVAPSGRRVHLGSRGFTRARLGFLRLIRVHVGSLEHD